MTKPIISTIGVFATYLFVTFVWAGETDNHQVTVVVNPINEIAVTGGNIDLTINSAVAGNNPTEASDRSTCNLAWTTNEANKKITVSSNLVQAQFSLWIIPMNVVGGKTVQKVELGTTDKDFISDISKTTGSCGLYYVAYATAAQGIGTDVHAAITCTLTDK